MLVEKQDLAELRALSAEIVAADAKAALLKREFAEVQAAGQAAVAAFNALHEKLGLDPKLHRVEVPSGRVVVAETGAEYDPSAPAPASSAPPNRQQRRRANRQ